MTFFLLTQEICSLSLSKGACLQRNAGTSTSSGNALWQTEMYLARIYLHPVPWLVCVAEPVEKSLFAKSLWHFDGLSDRVVVHERILQRGARPIRHPELDSGSVEVVAVCFTDPESSSG